MMKIEVSLHTANIDKERRENIVKSIRNSNKINYLIKIREWTTLLVSNDNLSRNGKSKNIFRFSSFLQFSRNDDKSE